MLSKKFDVVVVGSGAGGMATALTAALHGLRVCVLEKRARIGGTTAWSGGWMWVPSNFLARRAGINEKADAPLNYLRQEMGARFDARMAQAYLDAAPLMLELFERQAGIQFIDGNKIPDFHGKNAYALEGGRSVCAAPFDGRRLGENFFLLEPPIPETTLLGMGIASGSEIKHFLEALRNPRSFLFVVKRVFAHLKDLLIHRRGMRLVNGNALAGALFAACIEKGVEFICNQAVTDLVTESSAITGVKSADSVTGVETYVYASQAVVLATGGFPHNAALKKQLLPHAPNGTEHYSAACTGNTGDGIGLAQAAGGQLRGDLLEAAALAPVSLVPRGDSAFPFPHLLERGKPGLIAVTASGRRFTNEANSYFDVVRDLLATQDARKSLSRSEPVHAWLVVDHRFIRHYGLGAVKPAPVPLGLWIANGYLKRAGSLSALAQACSIDPQALLATVNQYNAMAAQGRDEEFGKGDTAYNRMQGDASCGKPNPCMAALLKPPYYAVKILVGSLGTFAGIRCNQNAQVLDANLNAIERLYAVGNDMSSIMQGHYPSGGITLGPAMTFGYLAGQHIAAQRGTSFS